MYVKTLLNLFLFTIIAFSAFSQVRFEKGYFIDNQDKRTECLVRNVGWDNNPESFRYKLPTGDEILTAGIADVKEFGIEGGFTYAREEVKIDVSPTDLKLLSHDRNPIWEQRVVFLNTLISGEAKLFLYKQHGRRQYYFQKTGGQIKPLVFKRYFLEGNQVQTNYGFRQELLNELKCGSLTQQYVARINYTDTDLIKYFEKYNACANPEYQMGRQKATRSIFRLKVTPGLDMTTLTGRNFTFAQNGDRKISPVSFRMGVEAEYVAGFNQNKWSLLLEPAFQYYKFPLKNVSLDLDVNYWSIDAPIGIRHYFYLSDKNRIFVNGLYVIKLKNKQLKGEERSMEIGTGSNAAFGAGFAAGKLSVEARYYLKRNVESSFMNIDADYTKFSLILGYTIFSR
ncbi:hypothetical protein [Dyadobacter bucti]|uniref:hypothetical protein n=1 Tax=Dyadobacter bucti TaxID=2572203 RepID=UPI003F712CC3